MDLSKQNIIMTRNSLALIIKAMQEHRGQRDPKGKLPFQLLIGAELVVRLKELELVNPAPQGMILSMFVETALNVGFEAMEKEFIRTQFPGGQEEIEGSKSAARQAPIEVMRPGSIR